MPKMAVPEASQRGEMEGEKGRRREGAMEMQKWEVTKRERRKEQRQSSKVAKRQRSREEKGKQKETHVCSWTIPTSAPDYGVSNVHSASMLTWHISHPVHVSRTLYHTSERVILRTVQTQLGVFCHLQS